MTTEQTPEVRVFEVELKVSTNGQESSSVHREYKSTDRMSTDAIAKDIWDSISLEQRAHMKPVNDSD